MNIRSRGPSREECQSLKPLTVTVRTALALLGIGRTTIYELIDQGVIETTRIGRRRLVIYSSLETIALRRSQNDDAAVSATLPQRSTCAPRAAVASTSKPRRNDG